MANSLLVWLPGCQDARMSVPQHQLLSMLGRRSRSRTVSEAIQRRRGKAARDCHWASFPASHTRHWAENGRLPRHGPKRTPDLASNWFNRLIIRTRPTAGLGGEAVNGKCGRSPRIKVNLRSPPYLRARYQAPQLTLRQAFLLNNQLSREAIARSRLRNLSLR